MSDKVTICTVHRDTPEWLEVALRRLAVHTSPRPRILVVDNGSGAEAAGKIASLCRVCKAEVLRLPEPVAHGAALDAAVAKVTTPWVLAIDSDAFPIRDGWLDAMLAEAGPNTVVIGASAGAAHSENPFGNYIHPSLCLVSADFLRWSGAAFRDAWPRWDTGEQVTIDAMRLGRDVRYLPTTAFGLFGHGVLVAGSVFHAYYGTRLKSASAKEIAQVDGIDVRALRTEHRRLLDAEAAYVRGGADPFGGERPSGVDMSVIVPFRRRRSSSHEDRNLLATVESLNAQTLERNRYEIVIVEADQSPSLDPPPGCRTVFAYCQEPLFRKSWVMNVGFRQSSGGILVFHDADVLAPPDMLESIAARIAAGSQTAKPSFSVFDLTREATETVHSNGIAALKKVPAAWRKLRSAPGGSIAVTRERFAAVRGYNERFAGWGGEDDEFLLRLRAQECDPPDLGCRLHHLWHECGPLDHRQVAANRRLVEHVRRLGRQATVRYIGSMPNGYGDANAFCRRAAAPPRAAAQVAALLAGAYSGYGPDANAGDDATRDVLVSLLKRKGCSVRISPGHPCTEGHVAGADMVVIGGGGLVADHSEDAFYNYMSYLKHAAARHIPAAVLGIGVCRLESKRRRISSLLRGATSVCVRDEMSREHLEDGEFATVAADLAWLLKPGRPVMPLERNSAGVFLVGDSYADNADYRNAVHQHVDGLVEQGLTPVLVLHAKDDRRAVAGFTRRYPNAKLLDYFASRGNTPSGIIATLSRMSQVATSRYHGIIFSVLAGTPCRVIPKSPEKVSFLCREVGAERLADKSRLEEIAIEMRKRARGNVRVLSGLVSKARLARLARERGQGGGTVVSVCMITLNEAPHVRKALASIPPSSQIGEILVVDGGSSDETVSILKVDGRVKLLHRPFAHDFSDQKNFCISQAAHDWVVWLDPDETFPPDFWASIDRLTASGHDAFWFPRENFIGGGPTPTNDLENDPDYQFRLFARRCRWTGRVHENLTGYAGTPGKADFVICHRKSRRRQDWNDAYYAWIKRGAGDRPSPESRAGA
jgi:glycosyltransferase involved in cell wall biosynthesis/polysaccharide pyruvyl transferase WcaK-like protein